MMWWCVGVVVMCSGKGKEPPKVTGILHEHLLELMYWHRPIKQDDMKARRLFRLNALIADSDLHSMLFTCSSIYPSAKPFLHTSRFLLVNIEMNRVFFLMFARAYVGDVKSFLESEFSWMDITAAQTGTTPTTRIVVATTSLSPRTA